MPVEFASSAAANVASQAAAVDMIVANFHSVAR
jgi:hypothetical protein